MTLLRTAFGAVCFILFISSALAQNGPPPVTVAKPVVKTIIEDDEFVGRFEAEGEVTVRARVSGYLEQVHFKDGSLVEKGQLLYTIDQRQFRTVLRQAQAQIDVAQATYDFASEQLERASRTDCKRKHRAKRIGSAPRVFLVSTRRAGASPRGT